MAEKIHLNTVDRSAGFPKLKLLEIGLCLAEVYNPQIACFWDETAMGFWKPEELKQVRGMCQSCVKKLKDQDAAKTYVFGFYAGKEDELPCETL